MLKIACPHCAVSLKLKDRTKVGKKIACPRCKQAFVLKIPRNATEDEFDFSGDGAEEDQEAVPVLSRELASPSWSTLAMSDFMNIPLVLGGASLAVFLVSGLMWSSGALEGSNPPLQTPVGSPPAFSAPVSPVSSASATQSTAPASPVQAPVAPGPSKIGF